jgi:hypothetical protein
MKNAGAGIRIRSLARLDSTAAMPASAGHQYRRAERLDATHQYAAAGTNVTQPAVPLTQSRAKSSRILPVTLKVAQP